MDVTPVSRPDRGTVAAAAEVLSGRSRKGMVSRLLPFLGPAFIASVAYIDPGNFATNVQGGAKFGYLLLWVVLAANGMAMLIQYLSAKLGIVTDRNLPELCHDHYPRPVSWVLWIQAEVMAMSTDIAEFLGAALGLNLLFHVPLLVAGGMTGFIAFVILAAYTYTSGLRAPAMIAVVKDLLIYITIITAVIYIPMHLGGFAKIFAAVPVAKLTIAAGSATNWGGQSAYVTLALGSAGYYARILHTNLSDALDQEYVRTARGKGLARRQVLVKHALANALIPLLTLAGLDLAGLPQQRSGLGVDLRLFGVSVFGHAHRVGPGSAPRLGRWLL